MQASKLIMKVVDYTVVNKTNDVFFLNIREKLMKILNRNDTKRKDKGPINIPKHVQLY